MIARVCRSWVTRSSSVIVRGGGVEGRVDDWWTELELELGNDKTSASRSSSRRVTASGSVEIFQPCSQERH
jgi:hypothetical protein